MSDSGFAGGLRRKLDKPSPIRYELQANCGFFLNHQLTRKSVMRFPMLLILALQCLSTTACSSKKTAPDDSLHLSVQRDSIVDFHGFLEALNLLVAQRGSSVELTIGPDDKKLAFVSVNGFPGEPFLIHVSPDQVAIHSGPSRQQLTVEQLQKQLEVFSEAGSSSGSTGIVLLISDKEVPGEFGLVILNVIHDSGIPTVMLSDPAPHEAPAQILSKKPSPPSSR